MKTTAAQRRAMSDKIKLRLVRYALERLIRLNPDSATRRQLFDFEPGDGLGVSDLAKDLSSTKQWQCIILGRLEEKGAVEKVSGGGGTVYRCASVDKISKMLESESYLYWLCCPSEYDEPKDEAQDQDQGAALAQPLESSEFPTLKDSAPKDPSPEDLWISLLKDLVENVKDSRATNKALWDKVQGQLSAVRDALGSFSTELQRFSHELQDHEAAMDQTQNANVDRCRTELTVGIEKVRESLQSALLAAGEEAEHRQARFEQLLRVRDRLDEIKSLSAKLIAEAEFVKRGAKELEGMAGLVLDTVQDIGSTTLATKDPKHE